MKTEFLKELGLEDDVIAKIQAESGKDVQREKDKYTKIVEELDDKKKTIEEQNAKIKELGENDTKVKELQEEITKYEKAETERLAKQKEEQENASLLNNFNEVVKDKKFVNDFTKDAIFNQVKEELAKTENKGKGVSELFDALTKDKAGIFETTKPTANLGTVGNIGEQPQTTADYIRSQLFKK